MQACIDLTFDYVHSREQFNTKIGEFQLIQVRPQTMLNVVKILLVIVCNYIVYNLSIIRRQAILIFIVENCNKKNKCLIIGLRSRLGPFRSTILEKKMDPTLKYYIESHYFCFQIFLF